LPSNTPVLSARSGGKTIDISRKYQPMRLFKILIGCCLLLIVSSAVLGQTEEWVKRYDGTGTDTPQKIKAFDDGVYLTSTVTLADGLQYAVFTKFDRDDGSVIWQYQFQEPSRFNDFEWNPELDEFILVGATTESGDNRSLIARMTDTGILIFSRIQEQVGREALTRIVWHPSLTDTDFPYVAVGFREREDAGNVTVLYNFSHTLNYNWQRAFVEASGDELEVYRGLVATTNDDVVLLGNITPLKPDGISVGAAVRVNVITAAVMETRIYYEDIVWNDGVELANGELFVAGDWNGKNNGQLGIMNPLSLELNEELRLTLVTGLNGVGVDNSYSDNKTTFGLYAVGASNLTNQENRVNGLSYTPGTGLTADYSHFLDLNGGGLARPQMSVTPADDRIYYADQRTFGGNPTTIEAMTVASANLDFMTSCVKIDIDLTSPSEIPTDSVVVRRIPNSNRQNGLLSRPEESKLLCTGICEPVVPCAIAIEVVSANCLEVEICATITGNGPFTYAWDTDCLGDAEYDTPCITHTFDNYGPQLVCLTAENEDGSCAFEERFEFELENEAPVITCPDPSSISLNTDPGECTATYDPGIMVVDDCTPASELIIECTANGVTTTGEPGVMEFPKGSTTVFCTATDGEGNSSRCILGVEVTDNEPPTITCPPSVSRNLGVCSDETTVNFADPVANDNCPMFTVETSHNSGDEFPQGTTEVIYTVTDMGGLSSSCSFNVTINKECLDLDEGVRVWCGHDPNTFNFVITGNDLAIPDGGECEIFVTEQQSGVSVNDNETMVEPGNSGSGFTITGQVILDAGVNITVVTILVNASCSCNDGGPNTQCVYPVTFSLPCCRDIGINGGEFCRSDGARTVTLAGCESLPTGTVVNWYKADEPCPDYGAFGTPFATTTGCEPLTFFPTAEDGDFCLYAQVDGDGYCDELLTDIETFRRCAPVSCSVDPISICISPGELTEGLELTAEIGNPTDCDFSIQWSDENGEIDGATNTTLPIGALSLRDEFTDCAESFVYTATVSSECGVRLCTGVVTLTNADAPIGELIISPPNENPLCVGNDARLEFIANCAGDPAEWFWQSRTDENEPYVDLPGTGRQNPFYNTNALSETTWYRVRATNGACVEGYDELRIDVVPEPEIYNFSAEFSPNECDVTGVTLSVDFGPELPPEGDCYYKVVWYRDLEVIGFDISYGGEEDHVYAPPSGQPLNGNYYAEIYSSCCDYFVKSEVIQLLDPIVVGISGPVFRCNGENITLSAVVLNLPLGESCTFKWFDGDTFIGTGVSIEIPGWRQGPISLIADCGGDCEFMAEYEIINCGSESGIIGDEVELKAWVAPNPSAGLFKLRTAREVEISRLIVTDANGIRRLTQSNLGSGDVFELKLNELPSGVYYLTALTKDGHLISKTITRM